MAGVADTADTTPFERSLSYRFNDSALLRRALTHRSLAAAHNERLEYLGDSLLGMIISEALYTRFPHATEGDLTRMRAHLVCRRSLAARARDLQLPRHVRLGEGARKSGGCDQDSILADTLEAIIGAVHLDSDLPTMRTLVLGWFARDLETISPGLPKDDKTRLQEYVQGCGWPLPRYQVVAQSGEGHAQIFTVECEVQGIAGPVTAHGSSRRNAEQRSAHQALAMLHADG